jgi:branched-chain amino acid transport system substrate-binding protein
MRVAIAVFALGSVALSGCNSGGSSGSDATGGAAAQGVTADTITIGTSLGQTGPVTVAAAGVKAGLDAGVKKVNDAGGINGRKVKLVVLDDGFDAARSVANIRRLGDQEKVFAVVSPMGSAQLPGSWGYVKTKGIPVVGPILPPDPKMESVFLLQTGHTDQIRVAVDFMAKNGVKKVGVIAQANELGQSIIDGVEKQAPIDDIAVAPTQMLEPTAVDVSSAVLNMKNAGADAVVFGANNTQAALVMKEAKKLNWSPQWYGDSSTMSTGGPGVVGAAGDSAVNVYGTTSFELPGGDSAAAKEFAAAVSEVDASQTSSGYAVMAYAAMEVFAQIVKDMGDDLTWNSFISAAEGLSGFDTGLLPPVTFGPLPDGRTGMDGAKMAKWDKGAWVTLDDSWVKPKS